MSIQRRLIVHEQAKSPISEAFRTLRTNIHFSNVEGNLRSLIITSPGPGEGKSTVLANMAVVISQAGKKVIIIDGDLRKPVQHYIFGKKNRGLTNYLVEGAAIEELLQETEFANLQVLTSGPIPPNPSELLGSTRMLELLAYLKSQCDFLLLDVPPIIAVTDACVLASRVDGIALIVGSGITRPDMAQQAKELILKANGKLLGIILNRVKIRDEFIHYYYYYGA